MTDYEDLLDFCSVNTKSNQEDLLDFLKPAVFNEFNNKIEINEVNSIPQTNVEALNIWKKNTNIINLLSSLDTVLHNSKWTKIGIYNLMDNKQIKIQYMKAMKIVHPDKCCDLDSCSKQHYNEIYDVLYASYHKHIQQN